MPLPKDPERVEEWKRKIGFSKLNTEKHPPYEIQLEGTIDSNIAKIEPIEKNPTKYKMPCVKIKKKKYQIPELSNSQLLEAHAKIHVIFSEKPEEWKMEDITNIHTYIVLELEKRHFKHLKIDDMDEWEEKVSLCQEEIMEQK